MIVNVPLTRIDANPWQTRIGEPDPVYIEELADDIAKRSLLQVPVGRLANVDIEFSSPAVVEMKLHEDDNLRVTLAFGHNRLAAFKFLQAQYGEDGAWQTMPVDIRTLTDIEMANMAWSENEKRRDVTPIERAKAIERRLKDFGWSNRQAAEALGIDHSTISNIVRLLKLPEDLQAALGDGRLSERVAMALLPMYEAPVKEFGNDWYGPSQPVIVKYALEGASSGFIREKVERLFDGSSEDLSKAPFKADQMIPEEGSVYCGMCKTCDKRMASRNLCFNRMCFRAKRAWVERQYLEKVSKATGYALTDENKGGVVTQLPTGDRLEKIVATKCANLRITYVERSSSQDPRTIPGHPSAYLVCEKRNNSCTCIKGLEELRSMERANPTATYPQPFPEGKGEEVVVQVQTADELEEAARQARRVKMEVGRSWTDIQAKLEEHLYKCLSQYEQVGVIRVALNGSTWLSYRDKIDDETVYREVAKRAVRAFMQNNESVDGLIKSINDGLERMNISEFSLDGKPAEVSDVEIPKL